MSYKIYKEENKKKVVGGYYTWYFFFLCRSQFCPRQTLSAGYPSFPHVQDFALLHCPLISPVFLLLHLFHWRLFSHFKEAPDSLLSCFHIHPESRHSWLTCSWHFPSKHLDLDFTGWLFSSVRQSWLCHVPWGCLHLISRTSVSGLLLSSTGHSFSVFYPWGTSSSSPSSLWVFSTSSV